MIFMSNIYLNYQFIFLYPDATNMIYYSKQKAAIIIKQVNSQLQQYFCFKFNCILQFNYLSSMDQQQSEAKEHAWTRGHQVDFFESQEAMKIDFLSYQRFFQDQLQSQQNIFDSQGLVDSPIMQQESSIRETTLFQKQILKKNSQQVSTLLKSKSERPIQLFEYDSKKTLTQTQGQESNFKKGSDGKNRKRGNKSRNQDDQYIPCRRKKKKQCEARNFISNLKKQLIYYLQKFQIKNQEFQQFKVCKNSIMHQTIKLFKNQELRPYFIEMFESRNMIRQYQLSKTQRNLLKIHMHELNKLKRKFIMICNKEEQLSEMDEQFQSSYLEEEIRNYHGTQEILDNLELDIVEVNSIKILDCQ